MKPVTIEKLYRVAKSKNLPFRSTKSLKPLTDIVGQERAQEAIQFAMSMHDSGYNVYAVGRNGLGKRTMMLRYLNRHAGDGRHTFDWCYVANFDDLRSPKVLKLPAGIGQQLKKDIDKLMERLVKSIPVAFDNNSYFERSDKLKNELAEKQELTLQKLGAQAKRKKISLTISTPGGYRLAALNGDKAHSEESYDALSDEEKNVFEDALGKMELKLRAILRKLSIWEQGYADDQEKLNEEVTLGVSSHLIDTLKDKYAAHQNVVEHLVGLQKDIIENLDIFLEDGEDQAAFAYADLDKKRPRRYQVNVLVHHKDSSAPIVVEESPNYHALFGYVENVTYKGTVFTDFSLIRAGSLHRANGGFLLMDAAKVLEQPYVWDGLKRALRANALNISSLEREITLSATISIEPQPIPMDLKIILFGDRETHLLLQNYDPEFKELFKVTADFESEMPRTDSTELQYAKFISSLVCDKGLLHCDQKAVARIIEYSSRQAENQNKLSLHAADIANLLRESNYWAVQGNANMIRIGHVEKALDSEEHRSGRIKDSMFESIKNKTTLLSTSGSVVGQINALAVLSTGDHEFGMPNRVTATCRYGDGYVLDIERDAKLGGTIHTKGVMILSSYLTSIFAKREPMHLSASITFEQSYGQVDGDSASLAELCALISALSEVPIRQDIAITGSVNQFGEVQPVGGLNQKIEGFYKACEIHGFTGTQGIILPTTNVQNLMLDKHLLAAIGKGNFQIYAVKNVSEALFLLTGVHSGNVNAEGRYPVKSIYGKIQALLDELRKAEKGEEKPAN